MAEKYTLQANDGITKAVFVPSKGALCTSFIVPDEQGDSGAREVLFCPEDFDVDLYDHICAGLPFHFPICGRLSRNGQLGHYLYRGQLYKMDIHGFTHQLAWNLVFHDASQIIMSMHHTDKTLAQYPFPFELTLAYSIQPGELRCALTVKNPGEVPLPFYAGFHPYFLIDPERYTKEKVKVAFEAQGTWRYNKNLTDIVGVDAPLKTPAGLLEKGVNECLSELNGTPKVRLLFPDGFEVALSVEGREQADMFRFLQMYHEVDQPFFCLEPWMAPPNSLNAIDGATWLAPGESMSAQLRLAAGGAGLSL